MHRSAFEPIRNCCSLSESGAPKTYLRSTTLMAPPRHVRCVCPEGEGNLRRVAERARKSGRLKVQEAPWRYAQVEKRRKSPALGEGTVGQHKDGQAVREQARQDRVLPAEQKGEQEDAEASRRAESSCKLSSESSRTASAACVVPLAAREPEVGSLGTDEEQAVCLLSHQ